MTSPQQSEPGATADAKIPITLVSIVAFTTALLGVAMIVLALAGGGGLGSYGVLVGAFFVAAGVMRLRLIKARARARQR